MNSMKEFYGNPYHSMFKRKCYPKGRKEIVVNAPGFPVRFLSASRRDMLLGAITIANNMSWKSRHWELPLGTPLVTIFI
jgi:hypothetical protein